MTVTVQQPSNIGTTTITSMNNVDATNSATMKNGMEHQQQHHQQQQQQPWRGSSSNIMTDHNKSNQMTSQQN